MDNRLFLLVTGLVKMTGAVICAGYLAWVLLHLDRGKASRPVECAVWPVFFGGFLAVVVVGTWAALAVWS